MKKPFEFEGAKPNYIKDRNFTLDHFDLYIDFEDIETKNEANCKITQSLTSFVDNPQKLVLDSINININSVKINGADKKFEVEDTHLVIDIDLDIVAGDKINIEIDYQIKNPVFGLNFVGPDGDDRDTEYQVWSQGESQQTSYWIPIYDAPNQICSNTKTITSFLPYKSFANGYMESEKEENGKYTSKWVTDQPLPVYLNALSVTKSKKYTLTNHDLDIDIANIIPDNKVKYKDTKAMNYLPEMISALSNFYNFEYPYKKYYQVWANNFLWGGMENTTLTINGGNYLLDDKAQNDIEFQETLIVHELGHQWFGNTVVINFWHNLWIKEGGAVFTEMYWMKYKYSKNKADYYRFSTAINEYISETPRPTQTQYYRHAEDLYDKHSYDKAGLVYAMIQKYIGNDKMFSKFIGTFIEDNKYQNVTENDFINAGLKATGKNFAPFIDQYIKRSGHLKLSTSSSWDSASNTFTFNINQTQYDKDNHLETLFVLNNIELDIYYLDKDNKLSKETKKVNISKPQQDLYFHLEKKPAFATIDSDFYFAFEQEYKFGQKELENIAKYHESILARINSIKTIGKKVNVKNFELFKELFEKDDEGFIQEEIANLLKDFKSEEVKNYILSTLKNPRKYKGAVQAGLIKSLKSFPTKEVYDAIKAICVNDDNTYSHLRMGYQVLGYIANKIGDKDLINETLEYLKSKLEEHDTPFKIVEGSIVGGISNLVESKKAFDFVFNLTKKDKGNGRLRFLAIMHITKFTKYNDPMIVQTLVDAFESYASEQRMDTQRYLSFALGAVSPESSIRFINATRILEKSTIHYRLQTASKDIRKSLIQNSNPRKANKKLLGEIEKKNKKIDQLNAELESIKFKFESFNKFMNEQKQKNKDEEKKKD